MTQQLVPMSIKGLMLDPVSNSPIVVLRDSEEKIFLPIWVGIFEANAIALQLESVGTPRPMTHDLLTNLLGELGASVREVVITELRDSTFYASLHLDAGGRQLVIDSRPSDALAIALRTQAPIFVDQSVLDQAQTLAPEVGVEDDQRTKSFLEQLPAEDLGKYKM